LSIYVHLVLLIPVSLNKATPQFLLHDLLPTILSGSGWYTECRSVCRVCSSF
jgi:hypothetical protein